MVVQAVMAVKIHDTFREVCVGILRRLDFFRGLFNAALQLPRKASPILLHLNPSALHYNIKVIGFVYVYG